MKALADKKYTNKESTLHNIATFQTIIAVDIDIVPPSV